MCLKVSCLSFHDDSVFVGTSASSADANAYCGVLLCEFSCSQSECFVFETQKVYRLQMITMSSQNGVRNGIILGVQ
jgi:hypothetical protein